VGDCNLIFKRNGHDESGVRRPVGGIRSMWPKKKKLPLPEKKREGWKLEGKTDNKAYKRRTSKKISTFCDSLVWTEKKRKLRSRQAH